MKKKIIILAIIIILGLGAYLLYSNLTKGPLSLFDDNSMSFEVPEVDLYFSDLSKSNLPEIELDSFSDFS